MSKTRWITAALAAAALAFGCGQSERTRPVRTESDKGILEQDKGVYEQGNPNLNGTGGSGSTSGATGNPSSSVGTGSEGLVNEDAQSPGLTGEQQPANGNHTKVTEPHSSTY